jgi:hypothetical protein
MNKNRVKKLEESAKDRLYKNLNLPATWRPEEGKIAIAESNYILERLRSLGREIVYSQYSVFKAVFVEENDREIIERIVGRMLFLKGIEVPISGLPPLIFVDASGEKVK